MLPGRLRLYRPSPSHPLVNGSESTVDEATKGRQSQDSISPTGPGGLPRRTHSYPNNKVNVNWLIPEPHVAVPLTFENDGEAGEALTPTNSKRSL